MPQKIPESSPSSLPVSVFTMTLLVVSEPRFSPYGSKVISMTLRRRRRGFFAISRGASFGFEALLDTLNLLSWGVAELSIFLSAKKTKNKVKKLRKKSQML